MLKKQDDINPILINRQRQNTYCGTELKKFFSPDSRDNLCLFFCPSPSSLLDPTPAPRLESKSLKRRGMVQDSANSWFTLYMVSVTEVYQLRGSRTDRTTWILATVKKNWEIKEAKIFPKRLLLIVSADTNCNLSFIQHQQIVIRFLSSCFFFAILIFFKSLDTEDLFYD